MSQTKSANFHENTIVKVPIAVIPRVGRSQQRSQTRPEAIRNEITRSKSISKINIFHFSFLVYKCFPSLDVCIITYYMKKSTLRSSLSRLLQPKRGSYSPFIKRRSNSSMTFTCVGSIVSPKCQPARTFSLSSMRIAFFARSRTLSALVAPY